MSLSGWQSKTGGEYKRLYFNYARAVGLVTLLALTTVIFSGICRPRRSLSRGLTYGTPPDAAGAIVPVFVSNWVCGYSGFVDCVTCYPKPYLADDPHTQLPSCKLGSGQKNGVLPTNARVVTPSSRPLPNQQLHFYMTS